MKNLKMIEMLNGIATDESYPKDMPSTFNLEVVSQILSLDMDDDYKEMWIQNYYKNKDTVKTYLARIEIEIINSSNK